jgi:uncharacterized membrane protein
LRLQQQRSGNFNNLLFRDRKISRFLIEREAAVLFDVGLQARIPDDVRASIAEHVRTRCATADLETRAVTIAEVGKRLGAWVPRRTDDVDELPNAPTRGGVR